MPSPSRLTSVWLIHGTWASQAPWTRVSSPITRTLQEHFADGLAVHRSSEEYRGSLLDSMAAVSGKDPQ